MLEKLRKIVALAPSISALSTSMIYGGTLLLSILSFCTTYLGMRILLGVPLAFAGSLGLQAAMLGTAWSLMKLKDNRLTYVGVFAFAATFSIFFSFANFDTSLKSDSRSIAVRAQYANDLRPILADYVTVAKQSATGARYKVDRLARLIDLEQSRGWATAADEGSGDPFIQKVIEGARHAVESWNSGHTQQYKQGSGRGIIVDYLESESQRATRAQADIEHYLTYAANLSAGLSGSMPVSKQYEMAGGAWAGFPLGQITELNGQSPVIKQPPDPAMYIEKPETPRQAFMLVLGDLMALDYTAIYSLLLAVAIDAIVILMAFAGSLGYDDAEYLVDRVRRDAARRIRELTLDDERELDGVVRSNLDRFRQAGRYSRDMSALMDEHSRRRRSTKVVLHRSGESVSSND